MTDAAAAPQNVSGSSLLAQDDAYAPPQPRRGPVPRLWAGRRDRGHPGAVLLLISILSNGLSSFRQTFIAFPITLEAERLDPQGNRDPAEMARVTTFGYLPIIAQAFADHMWKASGSNMTSTCVPWPR
jgi:phosphate transport system permease protein